MRARLVLVFVVLVAACKKTDTTPWIGFYGVEVKAPAGTDVHRTDSVLPGPGGQGGSPVGERPSVTLTRAQSFNVEVRKLPQPMTYEDAIAVLEKSPGNANFRGKRAPHGWELTYDMAGAPPVKVSLIYADLGGGHYECGWTSQSPDVEAAEAVCRSVRAR